MRVLSNGPETQKAIDRALAAKKTQKKHNDSCSYEDSVVVSFLIKTT